MRKINVLLLSAAFLAVVQSSPVFSMENTSQDESTIGGGQSSPSVTIPARTYVVTDPAAEQLAEEGIKLLQSNLERGAPAQYNEAHRLLVEASRRSPEANKFLYIMHDRGIGVSASNILAEMYLVQTPSEFQANIRAHKVKWQEDSL